MAEPTSESQDSSRANGNFGEAMISIKDIAAQKDNPELWLYKYHFYTSTLGLSTQEALRWADNAVRINTEARHEFDLA